MNTRLENLKANPALTQCLIGCIKNYKQQTKRGLGKLNTSKDVSWQLKTSVERIIEYDLRVYYAHIALDIMANQGVDALKPYLQKELCMISDRVDATFGISHIYFKIKVKVIGELISRLGLHIL